MEKKSPQYRGWMAEQIAKTYLYDTELVDVYQSDAQKYDFLCMLKNDPRVVFGVEVKSSKYSKTEIFRAYRSIREKYINSDIPMLILYINYENRTGYFEFILNQLNEDLMVLTTQNLKQLFSIFNRS